MKLKISEKEIQTQILEYLTIKKIFHWRSNTGGVEREHKGKKRFIRFGEKGISDILAISPDGRGTLVVIEVKRPEGKTTDEQSAFLRNVTNHGGIAIVVRSIDDLIKAFKAHFGEQWG